MKESAHLQSMRKCLALLLEEIKVISDNHDRREMEAHAKTLRGDIQRKKAWEQKQDAIRFVSSELKCGDN